MVSISIVHRIGPAKFIADAKSAGVDGFIFPDVPLEESADLLSLVQNAGLTASLLIAPTTDPARAAAVAKACTGFIYLLARTGITGEAATSPERKLGSSSGPHPILPGLPPTTTPTLADRITQLRQVTTLPIAIGFGISTPNHVHEAVHSAGADAAIVGSALVRHISDTHARNEDPIAAAESFVHKLATGLV
jgi:tryptophan synthase alpha chain